MKSTVNENENVGRKRVQTFATPSSIIVVKYNIALPISRGESNYSRILLRSIPPEVSVAETSDSDE